ncbi:MAG TPA: hypothetical protein VK845_00725 [Gemmatimonadales bacterium]|nr:hypothetical protein [Gemmatimonadales bacterium]
MQSQTSTLITIGLVGLGIGLGAGCSPRAPSIVKERCPDDRLEITKPGGGVVTDIPLATSIDEIHEFHDCQAFITGPNLDQFGPRVAIYASDQLSSLDLLVDTPQGWAVIYSDSAKYAPLAIEKGFNCLWLWKDSKGDPKAKISSSGYNEDACADGTAPSTPLEARYGASPTGSDSVPPVARWDFADTSQFIGIRCGKEEWCEIGHQGFGQSGDQDWPPGAGQTGKAHKALYDEERLAVRDPVSNKLVRAATLATAFPHPRLEERKVDYYKGKFKLAALVKLQEDLPEYQNQKNWHKGVNRVSLCWDNGNPKENCFGKDEDSTKKPSACQADPDARTWYSKTSSPGGNVTYKCVKRCDRNIPIPGTVRFRWLESDQQLWIRCATGCCTDQ